MITRRLACAAALAVTFTACDSGSGGRPRPTPSPSATDGLTDAQRELARLAGLAASASYDATYALDAKSGEKGTIRIVVAPPAYRVDVTLTGDTPSIYIEKAGTVVSCRVAAKGPSCFLVARPGEPVPEIFDPGVQRLFADAVVDLAANPARYDVDALPDETAFDSRTAKCFTVRRNVDLPATATTSASPAAAPSDPTGFETGDYCFAPDGVLTRLAVSTGTLALQAIGAAPTDAVFTAPATPAALPDLPSASPSATSSPTP